MSTPRAASELAERRHGALGRRRVIAQQCTALRQRLMNALRHEAVSHDHQLGDHALHLDVERVVDGDWRAGGSGRA
jgi:hypothetical protein